MAELWDIYDSSRRLTGRTVERGKPMAADEFHIAVQVWVRNSRGEWLISRRTPNKPNPLKWEPSGGSVLAGEDSLSGAVREVREELGIQLDPKKGRLCFSYRWGISFPGDSAGFMDVWLFEHDCPIEAVTLQEGETCGAMWVDTDTLHRMESNGELTPFSYPIPPN